MDMVPKLDVEDLAHETVMTYNRQQADTVRRMLM
jgi:hypothetical protein